MIVFKIVNKVLKIIEKILMVIVLIAIFMVLYNFIQLSILKKEYVNVLGYSVFEVISNSMAPTIIKKDIIVVRLTNEVEENDIITYKKDKDFITHRVTELNNDHVITRGDANNSKDVPIKNSLIIGKVVKIIKNAGIWKEILTSPKVLVLLIVTLVLFNLALSKDRNGTKLFKNKNTDFIISNDKIIEEVVDKRAKK